MTWVWLELIGSGSSRIAEPALAPLGAAQPGAVGDGQDIPRPYMFEPSLSSLRTLASNANEDDSDFANAAPRPLRVVLRS